LPPPPSPGLICFWLNPAVQHLFHLTGWLPSPAYRQALNRPHEIKLHVRGALNNGLTKSELMEVFLQSAIYYGVPAALDAMRVAKEVFAEIESDK